MKTALAVKIIKQCDEETGKWFLQSYLGDVLPKKNES